jgi:hypothetical protein
MIDASETIGLNLEEARARIEAARERFQQALDAQEGDQEAARRSLERLERLVGRGGEGGGRGGGGGGFRAEGLRANQTCALGPILYCSENYSG